MCKRRIIWQREQRPGLPGIRVCRDPAREASARPGPGCHPHHTLTTTMTDEACRTRSQKRALEREGTQNDVDNKKIKLEKGLLEIKDGELLMKSETAVAKVPGLLKGGEVKATIKVEVQTGDEPMDMSTSKSDMKREKRVPSPDVIVLSDNEPSSPRMNGLTRPAKEPNSEAFLLLQKSSPEERERVIKQLKEELRLEEAKLVLLKKLRQSQIQKETAPQKVTSRISGTVIPPPLVRGGQQAPSKQSTQIVMPTLVRGAQPISVSPHQIHNIRQHPSTGPPPLLLAPRASVPNVQMQGQRIIQQGLIRVANVPNTSLLVNIPQASPTSLKGSAGTTSSATSISSSINSNDSPASRQAAAKLALRKQLEKTLLEIPPPKPPAPELNFLPSAANNEFIYLVGLEEVVQNLLETQGKTIPAPSSHEPYSCAQCKTDFTSRWRQEKNGTIMCEVCMTSNQKKALKAEHTNRLKAAFVKALQQEQEIEQRILQQSSSPAQTKPEHPVQHHSLKQSPTPISRGLSGTTRGVLHTFPSTTKLTNAATLANRTVKPGERSINKGNMASGNWKKSPINAAPTNSAALYNGMIPAPPKKKNCGKGINFLFYIFFLNYFLGVC
ncbi:transcriptional repressor p66-alpha isoform X1 [Pelobates cultripes]|uniref:Transcriptional repressor p66-alpha isoform X1 n=1 Tax=Pelobates cultripes TaxID=61616 RepID=A0AAD1S5Y8_PELCU|nr:transcriptional repressor p66-alpha isoform X1 [Pelobates cultripes]